MHLNQMHSHHIEWTSRSYAAKHWSIATILVVGLAGLIHLSLIRKHFAEQFVYGLVFTALAVFQLTLALLLAVRPGPAVYRVGIWGSGLIVLIYIVTRLVPLPGASAPEELPVLSARRRNRARLCSSLDTMQEGGSRDPLRGANGSSSCRFCAADCRCCCSSSLGDAGAVDRKTRRSRNDGGLTSLLDEENTSYGVFGCRSPGPRSLHRRHNSIHERKTNVCDNNNFGCVGAGVRLQLSLPFLPRCAV